MNFASMADESFLDHCVSISDDDVSLVILTVLSSQSLVGRGHRVPAGVKWYDVPGAPAASAPARVRCID